MRYFALIIISFLVIMCNSGKQVIHSPSMNAPLIIYKTKHDYSNHIPVILNDAKDKIVSYPGISDIYFNGEFAKPGKLKDGYLLDNFGVSANSVYTSFTYEEYSKLEEVPSVQDFMDRIIDFDPFTELYLCGYRVEFKTIAELNALIQNNFERAEKIK